MQIGSIGATNSFSSFNINSASNISHSFAGGSNSSVSEVKDQALLFSATNDLLISMFLDDNDDNESKIALALDIYSASILLQNMISAGQVSSGTMSSAMNSSVGGIAPINGVSGIGGVVA